MVHTIHQMEAYKLEVADPGGSWKNDLSTLWIGIPRYKSVGSMLVIQSSSVKNLFQGFYLLRLLSGGRKQLAETHQIEILVSCPRISRGRGTGSKENLLSLCLGYFCNCSLLLHCLYFLLHEALLMSGGNAHSWWEGLDQVLTKLYSVTLDGIENPLVLHHASPFSWKCSKLPATGNALWLSKRANGCNSLWTDVVTVVLSNDYNCL